MSGWAVVLIVVGWASLAAACPTCACANPALTSMGAEQPTPNRVRLAVTARAWQQDEGAAALDATRLRELRVDLSASWAPTPWLSFALSTPLQLRERVPVVDSRPGPVRTWPIPVMSLVVDV